MGTAISLNGVSYTIPAVGEDNWGTDVGNYLIALVTGTLTKAGGAFTLTAETDFGATYGLKSVYFKSRGTTAATGVLRLANLETICWRDAANSADLNFRVNGSDSLQFNGIDVATISGTQTLTNKTLTSPKLNENVAVTATATQVNYLAAATGTTGTTSTNLVFSTSPTLTTPNIGTPSAGVLTNCTGLPVSSGISGLGTGVATFLATPSSANLEAAMTNETGTSGSLVFSNGPTLVAPILGTPASGTLTNCSGLPLGSGITGTLGVANGGTGLTGGTSGGVPYYSGAATLASSGALTASGVVLGGGAGAAPTSTAAGSAYNVLRVPSGGGAPAFGAIDISQSAAVTGTLALGNGGTGQTTAAAAFKALAAYSAKGDLVGYDGAARGLLAVGADGTVLTADAASTYGIKWGTALANPMATTGDMIYGGASGVGTKLATGATAGVLHGGNGAVPSWSQIVDADVATAAAITGSKVTECTQSVAGVVKSAGQLKGTNTNDSASAGYVGETARSAVAVGSAVVLTNSTFNDVTSITLSAGDWDIVGVVAHYGNGGSVTGTQFLGGIGTASGSSGTGLVAGDNRVELPTAPTTTCDTTLSIPCFRVSISGSTTYYLKAYAAFSVGTVKAYGRISARRVR